MTQSNRKPSSSSRAGAGIADPLATGGEVDGLRRAYEQTVAEKRAAQVASEHLRHERDLVKTVLVGFLGLPVEDPPAEFLRRALDQIARLVGADVGAIAVSMFQPEVSPLVVTSGCTAADHAFVEEELYQSNGVLKEAMERGNVCRLPAGASSNRVLESFHQRHVRAAISLPFLAKEAGGARGVLYLEHVSQPRAFEGELTLLHECLGFLERWIVHHERWEQFVALADHTAPFRTDPAYSDLVGRSKWMRHLLQTLELFRHTQLEAPVMLVGERGTGKETIAQTIHALSPRAAKPLHVVICERGAEQELERYLFGAEDERLGVHSPDSARGVFERCHGGTVYMAGLDRLGRQIQERLLHAISTRRFTRCGGERFVPFDVRLISSVEVAHGPQGANAGLVPDLHERLALFTLEVPSLNARREDVLPLSEHFLAQVCSAEEREPLTLTASALDLLERQTWPGNLAGLRGTIKRAAGLCEGPYLGAEHLKEARDQETDGDADCVQSRSWKEEQNEFQRRLIRSAMEQCNRNVTQAAKRLQISRQYLNNRIRILGMEDLRGGGGDRKDSDRSDDEESEHPFV